MEAVIVLYAGSDGGGASDGASFLIEVIGEHLIDLTEGMSVGGKDWGRGLDGGEGF